MKAANEKQSAPQSPTLRTTRRVEVEEITTEVLDNLLNELMKQNNKKEQEDNIAEAKHQSTGRLPTEKENEIKEKASDVLSVYSVHSETASFH